MKILIVKTSSLGDIVHAFPTLQYLRLKFPESRIDWVVESPYYDLIQSHPFINQVHIVDTKAWRKFPTLKNISAVLTFRKKLQSLSYDIVVDLQGNTKSAFSTWLAKSSVKIGFGQKTVPEILNLFFTNHRYDPPKKQLIQEDYLYLVQSYFQDFSRPKKEKILLKITKVEEQLIKKILSQVNSGRQKIMICPGTNWPNKQLSLETLKGLLKNYVSKQPCHFFFIWGKEHERKMCEELALEYQECHSVVDRLSFPVLQNLMDQMDLVVAVDSLALHLAGTTSAPTLSAFGPSAAFKYKPFGEQHVAIQGPCPYGITFDRRCKEMRRCPTGSCIKNITADQLFAAANQKKEE